MEVDDAVVEIASTVGKCNAWVGSSSVESLARDDMACASSGNARCTKPMVSRNLHERAFPYRRTLSKRTTDSFSQLSVAFRCIANQSRSCGLGRASVASSAVSRPISTRRRTGGVPCRWIIPLVESTQPVAGRS